MDRLYLGHSGSGKSYEITAQIRADLLLGERVMLLIPEQDSMNTELRITSALSDVPTVDLEILNFNRLANLIFRTYGGLNRRPLTHGGKRIVMSRALQSVAQNLSTYQKIDACDKGTLDGLIGMIDEFRTYCITPAQLQHASETMRADPSHAHRHLADKTTDFSLIYAAYDAQLDGDFYDASEDLQLAAELLDGADFFRGMHVYLDGYHGFTPVQYLILEHIAAQAKQLTVSFSCLPQEQELAWMFSRMIQTHRNVTRILRRNGREWESVVLTEQRRCSEANLIALKSKLWDLRADSAVCAPASSDAAQDAIRLFMHPTVHDEADFICRDILRRVQEGCRYRDITVVSRDIERYRGILDSAFAKYGIPFYFSARDVLSEKSLFRFVYSLLRCCIYNSRRDDVISLIKTDYLPLTDQERACFENYAEMWKLSGKRFWEEEDWYMNPDGFVPQTSERAAKRLQIVNTAKQKLRESIFPFIETVGAASAGMSAAAFTELLVNLLAELRVPHKLREKASLYEKLGYLRQRDLTAQLWDTFCALCDELTELCGEEKLTAEQYLYLLDMLVSDTDIGTIPAGVDCVTFGDAALLRPENCVHMYLIGVTEGSFPMNSSENPFFSDSEKEVLKQYQIALSPDTESCNADESFYFYYAIGCAAKSVTVSAYSSDLSGGEYLTSFAFSRVERLSGASVIYSASLPYESVLWGKEAAAEQYGRFQGTAIGQAMMRYYRDAGVAAFDRLLALESAQSLSTSSQQVHPDLMQTLLGRHMQMSPSRLERYVQCRFAYFCDYILKLDSSEKVSFGAADTGNFIHFVMERFVRAYAATEKPDFTDEQIDAMVDRYIEDYLLKVSGSDAAILHSRRLRALFARMKRTTRLLIRNLIAEFEQSAFAPAAFELSVGEENTAAVPGLCITDDAGNEVVLSGRIDRVDIWKNRGKTYLRVIDYKTGTKKFDLEQVRQGLNMQMLIYLFSLWANGEKHFDSEVVPAGVLYVSAKAPDVAADFGQSDEQIRKLIEKSFKRSGYLLDDREVLAAMEKDLSGKYIPVTLKNDGTYDMRYTAPLASLESMGELKQQLEKTVTEITGLLRGGSADAIPLCDRTGKSIPCQWCSYKPVCRRTGQTEEG